MIAKMMSPSLRVVEHDAPGPIGVVMHFFADVKAAATHFKVAPGTIHYWVSLYKVSSMTDPIHPRRKLYSLAELEHASTTQAAKRAAREKKDLNE